MSWAFQKFCSQKQHQKIKFVGTEKSKIKHSQLKKWMKKDGHGLAWLRIFINTDTLSFRLNSIPDFVIVTSFVSNTSTSGFIHLVCAQNFPKN